MKLEKYFEQILNLKQCKTVVSELLSLNGIKMPVGYYSLAEKLPPHLNDN